MEEIKQGQQLEDFVNRKRIKVPEVAEALGLTRTHVYGLFKAEKIKEKHLRALKAAFGFEINSLTNQTNTTIKQDNPVSEFLDYAGDKELFGGFAVRIYEKFKNIDNLKAQAERHEEKLQDHSEKIESLSDKVLKLMVSEIEVYKRLDALEVRTGQNKQHQT